MSGAVARKAEFEEWEYERDDGLPLSETHFDLAKTSFVASLDVSMAFRKRQFRQRTNRDSNGRHNTDDGDVRDCPTVNGSLFVCGFITFVIGLLLFLVGFLFPTTFISLVGSGLFTMGSGCIAWFVMENGRKSESY